MAASDRWIANPLYSSGSSSSSDDESDASGSKKKAKAIAGAKKNEQKLSLDERAKAKLRADLALEIEELMLAFAGRAALNVTPWFLLMKNKVDLDSDRAPAGKFHADLIVAKNNREGPNENFRRKDPPQASGATTAGEVVQAQDSQRDSQMQVDPPKDLSDDSFPFMHLDFPNDEDIDRNATNSYRLLGRDTNTNAREQNDLDEKPLMRAARMFSCLSLIHEMATQNRMATQRSLFYQVKYECAPYKQFTTTRTIWE